MEIAAETAGRHVMTDVRRDAQQDVIQDVEVDVQVAEQHAHQGVEITAAEGAQWTALIVAVDNASLVVEETARPDASHVLQDVETAVIMDA